VIYLLFKSYRAPKQAEDTPVKNPEDMVRCVHCGVHLPVGESIRAGDQVFCSAEHRDAHQS
ncbi:MAG: PP0621 family protein, partial [Gallionella sp.]